MQLKIYQKLNQLLLALLATTVLLIIFIIMNLSKFGDHKMLILIGFLLYSFACFFIFKLIETNWDKHLVQKMALNNQIVLARIKKAEGLMYIKDSAGKYYVLWQLTVDFWDHDMKKHETHLVEKISPSVKNIPFGNIYITYNPEKPEQLFVVPNVMIGNLPDMMPIVAAYEKNKAIPIKYLNVYYKDGMIIETFETSLKSQNNQNQ